MFYSIKLSIAFGQEEMELFSIARYVPWLKIREDLHTIG